MRSLEQVNIRTNVRTYVRTYSHTYVRDRPYIPSTTLLCEGIIRLDVSSRQRIHMKNQALFSSKDKNKKLKCRLLQFLFGALRVHLKMMMNKYAKLP